MRFVKIMALVCFANIFSINMAMAQIGILEYPEEPAGYNGHMCDKGIHALDNVQHDINPGGLHSSDPPGGDSVPLGYHHLKYPDEFLFWVEGAILSSPEQWISRIAIPAGGILMSGGEWAGAGVGKAVTVSPDGKFIYMTGSAHGMGIFFDAGAWGTGDTRHNYVTVAYDAARGEIIWARYYDGEYLSRSGWYYGYFDVPSSIVISQDGKRVYVTGYSWHNESDYLTIAYDAVTGDVLWAKRYNGTLNHRDAATAITVSPDDAMVFVTGSSVGEISRSADYLTIAYDAITGAMLWAKRYDGSRSWDQATAISVSPDSSKVYVTGRSDLPETGADYLTIAYDRDGNVLWTKRHTGIGGIAPDEAFAIKASPDNEKVYVTGYTTGILMYAGSRNYTTIAYNAATGDELWARLYGNVSYSDEMAYDVAVSPDGSGFYVSGYSWASGTPDYLTIKYSKNGDVLWTRRYRGPGSTYSNFSSMYDVFSVNRGNQLLPRYSLAVDLKDNVYVAGASVGEGTDWDYLAIAYDNDGRVLWARRVPLSQGIDGVFDVAVSPDGNNVYLTGGVKRDEIVTIAYQSSSVGLPYDMGCPTNIPPDCSGAAATVSQLWPPNHGMNTIDVAGVTDPDNDPVSVIVTGITQDEPVRGIGFGNTGPDGSITGSAVFVRAEREGNGDGRVYNISFTATDGKGGQCSGSVSVCVPHDFRGTACIDNGQTHDSTLP